MKKMAKLTFLAVACLLCTSCSVLDCTNYKRLDNCFVFSEISEYKAKKSYRPNPKHSRILARDYSKISKSKQSWGDHAY